jgi:hypothetical protein
MKMENFIADATEMSFNVVIYRELFVFAIRMQWRQLLRIAVENISVYTRSLLLLNVQ